MSSVVSSASPAGRSLGVEGGQSSHRTGEIADRDAIDSPDLCDALGIRSGEDGWEQWLEQLDRSPGARRRMVCPRAPGRASHGKARRPWITGRDCGAWLSTMPASGRTVLSEGLSPRSSIRRRWRWSAWPLWSPSVAPNPRTAPRPMPLSARGNSRRDRRRAVRRRSGCRAPPGGRGRPEGGDGARLRPRRGLRTPLCGVRLLPAEQTRRRRLLHRFVARGDTQLSIDRAHLGVDGVAGHEQPVRDVANREMGLQVREESQLSRSEG